MDLLNITYTETDSDLPAIVFNGDIIVPITNITFAKSFVNFVNNDMEFKLYTLSGNGISFTDSKVDEVLNIHLKGDFVGCVELEAMTEVMYQVLDKLKELKKG